MSEILSSEAAMELAVGLAASQKIILEALFENDILDREDILRRFDQRIEYIVVAHEKIDAANILRLIRGEIGESGRA